MRNRISLNVFKCWISFIMISRFQLIEGSFSITNINKLTIRINTVKWADVNLLLVKFFVWKPRNFLEKDKPRMVKQFHTFFLIPNSNSFVSWARNQFILDSFSGNVLQTKNSSWMSYKCLNNLSFRILFPNFYCWIYSSSH